MKICVTLKEVVQQAVSGDLKSMEALVFFPSCVTRTILWSLGIVSIGLRDVDGSQLERTVRKPAPRSLAICMLSMILLRLPSQSRTHWFRLQQANVRSRPMCFSSQSLTKLQHFVCLLTHRKLRYWSLICQFSLDWISGDCNDRALQMRQAGWYAAALCGKRLDSQISWRSL